MNRKGQALVEFVLIIPVFLMVLFMIIDFGMIFNKKSELEHISNDAILVYNENKSISEIQALYKDIKIEIYKEDTYTKLTFQDEVNIITPGMNIILDNPYVIKVERVVPDV